MTLPMVLLIVLFGVDFGRVFLGWVTLTNAVREGANYAAVNPTAWGATPNLVAQAEYRQLIVDETTGVNCTLPSPVPAPAFPSGSGIGSPAVVTITCSFSVITPIVNLLVGNTVAVTASSAFPIRTGTITGVPVATTLPTSSPSPAPSTSPAPSGSVAPTSSPTSSPSPGPTGSAGPTPTPAPTIPPTCTVPNINGNSRNAVTQWTAAGFTASNLIFSPLVPPHYSVKSQSLTAYTVVLCSSTMTVTP
jgi:Flp pilus assembly protein TadG